MAAGTAAYMRLSEVTQRDIAAMPVIGALQKANYAPKIIDWHIQKANAADAACSIPNAELDGTGTAVLLKVVSASADDTDAADKDVREVTIIGLTNWTTAGAASATIAVPKLTTETVKLNGATAVATTYYYMRVFHMYASSWGSHGTDAAGAITLTNTAGAVTYHTIAIGTNESEASAIFLSTSMEAMHLNTKFSHVTQGAAGRGTIFYYNAYNVNGLGTDPDTIASAAQKGVATYTMHAIEDTRPYLYKSDGVTGYVQFKQAQITGEETYSWRATFLVYGTTNSQRGIPA